jgi:hypothetical protein
MAKAKSPAKSKAARPKAASKSKAAPKQAASKLAKAAASVVKALAPKKANPQPPKPIATPAPKPAPQPAAQPTAPAPPGGHMSWSDSLRKAMQDKNAQKHWPENKQDWKDRQRSGLSISHRNKFG